MKYLYLTEVGHLYQDEGCSADRLAALEGLETQLRAALTDLINARDHLDAQARRARPVLPGKQVAQVVAHLEAAQAAQQNFTIRKLQAEFDRLKDVLQRAGCEVYWNVSGKCKIGWVQSKHTVVYDKDLATQGMTRVRFIGGRLFLDDAGSQPLDTSTISTPFQRSGAIFVMSATGNIHVSSQTVGKRHHSSLLAGQNVAGAGEMEVKNGILLWLSNKSGHYKPSLRLLLQVLHQLQKRGVPMTFALDAFSPDPESYATVGDFLKFWAIIGRPDYEYMKLLRYSPHLKDGILSTHTPDPWRWRKEGEVTGVYSTVVNSPVPHKMVRKWLKAKGLYPAVEVDSGAGR